MDSGGRRAVPGAALPCSILHPGCAQHQAPLDPLLEPVQAWDDPGM